MEGIYITGIGNVLGENYIPLSELAKEFNMSKRKFKKMKNRYGNSGVYRFTQQKGIEESACEALDKATNNAGISHSDINGLFYTATTSCRYYVPDLGKIVSSELGLSDIKLVPAGTGCTGGLCAIYNAYNALIRDSCEDRKSTYVVLMGESNGLHTKDNPETVFLFSDNASAVVLSNNLPKDGYLIKTVNGITTKGDPYSMTLTNPSFNKNKSNMGFKMQGDGVFTFAMDEALPRFAPLAGLEKISDANYFIPSQTIIALLKQMIIQEGLDQNRVYTDGIRERGNTNGGAVFSGLEDAIKKEYITNQDDILLSVFGANLQVYSAHLLPRGNVKNIVGANEQTKSRPEKQLEVTASDRILGKIGGFLLRHGVKI